MSYLVFLVGIRLPGAGEATYEHAAGEAAGETAQVFHQREESVQERLLQHARHIQRTPGLPLQQEAQVRHPRGPARQQGSCQ